MNRVENKRETECIGANEEIDAVSLPARHNAAMKGRSSRSLAGHLMRQILRVLGDPLVQVTLWNGETIATSPLPPVARITLADRMTLIRLFRNPLLRFGEAYSEGKIIIDGNLTEFLAELYRSQQAARSREAASGMLKQTSRPVRSHSLATSRENIHRHYDIGNDFYAMWLGDTMAYTCAYFPTRDTALDQAQIAKMHHVSRKLRLKPGDRVVEAGCGWGAQALLMARDYGVKVTAFNISRQQIEYAREHAKAAGLEARVEYIEDDYRNITGSKNGRFDAFVSIGMLEHVGVDNYPEFGRVIRNCLKPSGMGLLHSIGRNCPLPLNPWIEKHIFPGAYTPSLAEMMSIFESSNLSVLDVENLRLHYASTLHCWRVAFEQSKERVASMFDETFVRMWRLYLAGSEAAFIAGQMQLFQVLIAPQTNNTIPWTRADLYRDRNTHAIL